MKKQPLTKSQSLAGQRIWRIVSCASGGTPEGAYNNMIKAAKTNAKSIITAWEQAKKDN